MKMTSATGSPALGLFLLLQFSFLLFSSLICLSDSASVKVPREEDDDAILESLASSKILMDRTTPYSTSSSYSTSPSAEITQLGLKSTFSSSPKSTKVIQSHLPRNKEDGDGPPGILLISPLHVAQCRATCLEKLTETTSTNIPAGSTPTSVIKIRAEGKGEQGDQDDDAADALASPETDRDDLSITASTTDEIHLMPKILRLKRSPLRKWSATRSPCSKNVECLSCWKSCQLFETLGEANPVNLFPPQKAEAGANEATAQPQNFPPESNSNGSPTPSYLGDGDDQMERQTKAGKKGKSKQPIFLPSCPSMLESKQCIAGCQVACSFYDRLFTSNPSQGGNERKSPAIGKGMNPVVATKQESLLKILPGKLTWPGRDEKAGLELDKDGMMMTPVVYMVIQEYPDRKWRQIAQTTETELSIPKELTSGMKTKLRSIRVLVVGPEGLLSVYTSNSYNVRSEKTQEQKKFEKEKSNNSEKVVVVEKEEEGPTTVMAIGIEENDKEYGSESDGYVAPEHTTVVFREEGKSTEEQQIHTDYITEIPKHSGEDATNSSPVSDSAPSEPVVGHKVTEEPFELRVVSLIHQKSLVIAELKWDGIGGNPNQEYLITWELTGGGLKGHLVTDSMSVTLSLWPDTTYQIQVELFEQNLDYDGEQPVQSSPTSLKSLPLTVDTAEASFPTGSSSALRKSEEEEESYDSQDHLDEDEFPAERNGNESEEEEKPTHKSFMNLPTNLSLFLSTTAISAMLVLVTLTLAGYAWARLRLASKLPAKVGCCFPGRGTGCCDSLGSDSGGCGCFSYCFPHSEKEPQLLSSQEDLSPESSSPFYYAVELKKSQQKGKWRKGNSAGGMLHCSFCSHQDKVAGQGVESGVEAPVMPVAVISSSSSISTGGTTGPAPFHYYSYKDGLLPSFMASSRAKAEASPVGEGLINGSEQGCTFPSSSSRPSGWLPNFSSSPTNKHTTEA